MNNNNYNKAIFSEKEKSKEKIKEKREDVQYIQ